MSAAKEIAETALGVLLDGKEEIQIQLKVTITPEEFIETDFYDWEESHKKLDETLKVGR
jgi:hypothetical protein